MARSRQPKAKAKAEAIDQALRGLFRGLQARPVPDSLRRLVDQLREAPRPTDGKRR